MRAIEWDSPGDQSVAEYYAKDPNIDATPHKGSVLSARFRAWWRGCGWTPTPTAPATEKWWR